MRSWFLMLVFCSGGCWQRRSEELQGAHPFRRFSVSSSGTEVLAELEKGVEVKALIGKDVAAVVWSHNDLCSAIRDLGQPQVLKKKDEVLFTFGSGQIPLGFSASREKGASAKVQWEIRVSIGPTVEPGAVSEDVRAAIARWPKLYDFVLSGEADDDLGAFLILARGKVIQIGRRIHNPCVPETLRKDLPL